jgi:ribonuclease HI
MTPATSPKSFLLTYTFLVVLLAGLMTPTARAQDSTSAPSPTPSPTATPDSEELRRLRERNAVLDEEKKAAESEKTIAEDKKAKLAAEFPSPKATPLEGKTDIDSSVKIESQIITYKTVDEAANKIVSEIKANVDSVSAVAVHNDKDVRALLSYMATLRQLRLMGDEYNKILPGAVGPAPLDARHMHNAFIFGGVSEGITAANSVLGGFIDLIALLRTDTTIRGLDVSVEEPAIVSEVFKAIRNKDDGYGTNVKLYYPAVVPPNFNANSESEFLGAIEGLNFLKSKAAELITKIGENEKAYDDTKGEIATLKKRQKQIPDEIKALDDELEGLQKVHWKWPSSRLAERMEEIGRSIKKLAAEQKKNAATLGDDATKLQELQKAIDTLYGEILPTIPAQIVLTALDKADNKVATAEAILGRDFTDKEKEELFGGFEDDTKKSLIKEAEQRLHRPLKDDEKAKLTEPLNDAEKDALQTIYEKEQSTHKPLSAAAKVRALSGGQQTALLGDLDQDILRQLKKVSLARLKSMNDQYDKMVADLTKTDAATGTNPLTLYLQAENMRGALDCVEVADPADDPCPGSYFLQLKVLVAGGNTKTTKNLITNVFTGANISHSGGSIVEFNFYDMTGASKASDTFAVYEGYTNAKNIKRLSEGDAKGAKGGADAANVDAVKHGLYERFAANRNRNPDLAYKAARAYMQMYPDEQGGSAVLMKTWVADYEKNKGTGLK